MFQHQSGFLPCHSTVTQLCFLPHKWHQALDKGDHVQAAFLDLSKAYYRVAIPGLTNKLSSLGFSGSLVVVIIPAGLPTVCSTKWLSSFLQDCQQCVRLNGWQSPKSGIPQGTVLGHVLFLVFINDQPQSMGVVCSIFAEDTTAYTKGKDPVSTCHDLSGDLHLACDWAFQWGCCSVQEKLSTSVSRRGKHPLCSLGCPWVERSGTYISQATQVGVHQPANLGYAH